MMDILKKRINKKENGIIENLKKIEIIKSSNIKTESSPNLQKGHSCKQVLSKTLIHNKAKALEFEKYLERKDLFTNNSYSNILTYIEPSRPTKKR